MHLKNIDKYLYIRSAPTLLVRGVYIIGILTWSCVIYGYSRFLVSNFIFFLIIAPIIGFVIFHHILSYSIILFYKQLDLKKHIHFVKTFDIRAVSLSGRESPLVDVFLPICGESLNILQNTFLAVAKLDYPNKKIYVLDDSHEGCEENKKLSAMLGFTYLSRHNKGYMKKAGNLKHGYENSEGEFIVIFDADFAPRPEFISELLPYMEDKQIGIIQSPQYFPIDSQTRKNSALEYGAAHVQEDFYRFIQVAQSRLGAPTCCGSNAIYRRKALDAIGGTIQIEHSEDAYTGFMLMNKGWKVIYLPIILAIGLCPSDLHSYFHQQHRWCSGSLSIMLSKHFWKSNLSISQKLCFIAGFTYYMSHPVAILLSFQIFFLLFLYNGLISFHNALPFLPSILFSFLIIPFFRISKAGYGGFLARNAYLYTYTHATFAAFCKRSIGWQPTNTKRVDVSQAYMEQFLFATIYFLLYISCIAFSVGFGVINVFNIDSYTLLFWIVYNVVSSTLIVFQLYMLLSKLKWKKVKEGSMSPILFFNWKIKTLGFYLVLLTTIGFSTFYTGRVLSVASASKPPLLGITQKKTESLLLLTPSAFPEDKKIFDEDSSILKLQKFLNSQGYVVAEHGAGSLGHETEYFGPRTKQALRQFQKAYTIPETGYFGSTTRDIVNGLVAKEN